MKRDQPFRRYSLSSFGSRESAVRQPDLPFEPHRRSLCCRASAILVIVAVPWFGGANNIWRSALLVGLVLAGAFALTGTISSAYRRERVHLGELHYTAGENLRQRGDNDGAIDQYRKALLFTPDAEAYRLSLATALLGAGHLEEAESHLDQLAQDNPTNPLIYLALARIAVSKHETSRAIEDYERGVYEYWPPNRIPVRHEARWELVNLLADNGRRYEAVAELIQLYATASPELAERVKIGTLLLTYGAPSEASRIFTELVRQFPKASSPHRGLGDVDLASGDYVSARHEFQRALKLTPADQESQEALALTNSIIDLDAALPGISAREQLRRGQNLLRRVLDDLSSCPPDALTSAQTLLTGNPPPDDQSDYALTLLKQAQTLWNARKQMCGTATPKPDRAVDLLIARMANE